MSGRAESAMVCCSPVMPVGYEINETAGIFRYKFQPPLGRGGGGQEHRIEAGLAHHFHVIARLFDTRVGEQATVDPGRFGVARDFFKAVAQHRVQIREKQQRNFRTPADVRRDVENLRERGPGCERAVAGLLDHGAIRDRIRKGNAQLDQIGATAFERLNEAGRGHRRRIPRRQISDHSAAIFALQGFKKPGDSRHAG